MKETYVFGQYPNGMVTPIIIRQKVAPLVSMGDKLITDRGNMICLSEEKGRYSEFNELDLVCKLMELGKDSLPMAIGTVTERYWNEEEK